ncbi:response regulator transcription factor [Asaccharospora irregularis]|uniref:Stage 0 sporulation protein A homolog n=1 Tax=Asaccharospora irregularis DSM 2635 TaxID=1121321 RepID=A0A1M5PIF0_9FIRM|nr:response regulator transcription factor [Asaccharospora irregularis]SHH01309.1 DNA-binding response regulator, OmpR family, contains REC and winged-helix (wHTH) domain [Asaccharospora irregularis DSM 2635]
MKYKMLVIDDEVSIVSLLKDFFELEDFLVYTAYSGDDTLKKININPDIILLDINMPGMDGIEVCTKIRNYVSCPIVFLTAKVEESDRIKGLMVGGDDYILKPFSIEELNARVKAHLRREERKTTKEKVKFSKEIVINYSDRKAFCRENEINLTKTEFDILENLSMNSGRIFSKEDIYEKLWGFDKEGDSSIITEHIRRIRMKLGKYTDDTIIETVWGVGYKWIG